MDPHNPATTQGQQNRPQPVYDPSHGGHYGASAAVCHLSVAGFAQPKPAQQFSFH